MATDDITQLPSQSAFCESSRVFAILIAAVAADYETAASASAADRPVTSAPNHRQAANWIGHINTQSLCLSMFP